MGSACQIAKARIWTHMDIILQLQHIHSNSGNTKTPHALPVLFVCLFLYCELVTFPLCFTLSFFRSLFFHIVDGGRQNCPCPICVNIELNLFQDFLQCVVAIVVVICSVSIWRLSFIICFWFYVVSFFGTLILVQLCIYRGGQVLSLFVSCCLSSQTLTVQRQASGILIP